MLTVKILCNQSCHLESVISKIAKIAQGGIGTVWRAVSVVQFLYPPAFQC